MKVQFFFYLHGLYVLTETMKGVTKKVILVLLANILVYCGLKANDTIIYTNATPQELLLNPSIYILPDSSAQFSIQDIIQLGYNFPQKASEIKSYERYSAYWGIVHIKSQLEFDKFLKLYWHSVSALRLDDLQAWILVKDSIVQYYNFGYFEPASNFVGTNQRGNFNFILPADSSLTLVLRIQNSLGFKPTFDVRLNEPEFHANKDWSGLVIHIFYEGLLWIMIVYNLIIFFSYFDRAYLYYALYIAGSAVYSLFFFRFLLNGFLTETPHLNPYFWLFSLGFGSIFYFQFARYFLNIKKILSDKWEKYIFYFIVLKLILLAVQVFIYAIYRNIFVVDLLVSIGIILETIFTIVLLTKLLKTGQKVVYFFMGGSLALWIGFFTGNFMHMSGIPNGQIYGEMGVVGEVLIFSLGLGFRMKQNEVEKRRAKEELIQQLKENEKLQLQINTELEGMVKERTAEIMAQQEEIRAQNEEILRANSELVEAYQHITDSINYARRIQSAILPDEKEFADNMKEFFVYYLPRDIVSGDFYWIKTIDNYVLVAAVDCTGHGVPGAFLSLLGNSFLNEIATYYASSAVDIKANIILDVLRTKMKYALKNHSNESSSRDGMDAALCVINKRTMRMSFAGAHNPLYLIRNKELHEFKGNYMPIGYHLNESPFDEHEIQLMDDDKMYIFSDGFTDQFGGAKGYKYKAKQFKEFLMNIHDKPMAMQRNLLSQEFNRWKGTDKQLDDLLIVGFMISTSEQSAS